MKSASDAPRIPCICGGRKTFERCCLPALRNERPAKADLTPPPPATGRSNARCYLCATSDCSETTSREHYVSDNVLRILDEQLEVAGFPWLAQDETKRLPVSALTAGVLCSRHNSALSPLDEVGGAFVGALREFAFPEPAARRRVVVLNGRDVERWVTKCLFGLFASRNLQVAPNTRAIADISERCVELLYDREPWVEGRGFYMRTAYPRPTRAETRIEARAIFNPEERTIQGLRMTLLGLDTIVSTCPIAVEGGLFRPSFICFVRPSSTRVIRLHWDEPGPREVLPLFLSNPPPGVEPTRGAAP